jgi:hypothetical protein
MYAIGLADINKSHAASGNSQHQPATSASTSKGTLTSKAKNGVYKILANQKSAITKIAGVILPEAINNLKNKIGGIFTILKSTHFDKGQCYGYLVCVIPEKKYRVVIANAGWTYMAPINPGTYAATALGTGVSAAQQEQIVANHKDNQISYAKYLGMQEARKELILYSVGDDALTPIKKQYINFRDATIHTMIKHLCKKTAIKNDDIPKVQLQNREIQEGLGPNNEHNGLLHWP